MNDLKGKRLLLLGGVQPACEIVKEAQKMGVTVLVTDYLADSPAKKLADKSFMVNAMDVDAVVKLCKDEQADGLITGYVDSLLPYAEEICRKSNLSFWGNAENIDMSINKDKFKLACEKSGLPVVPWKKVNRDNFKDISDIKFPVVIKPVDNSGSRGVFKCYNSGDYESLCEKAFTFSKCGELLIERLMNAHNEFSAYYMIDGGEAVLTGMGDRYVNIIDDSIAPVGQGMYLPSARLKEWTQKVNPSVVKFFADNNMNNGFVFVQGFYEDGGFYIHEIGYRLNGGFSYKLIESFSGYNQVRELIRFSLTGSMDKNELKKSNPFFDGSSFILTLALKPGIIGSINGVDKASEIDGVVEFCQLKKAGDKLMSKGTTAQVFAYVLIACENIQALKKTITAVENAVEILDTDGNNMLWDPIDPKRIKC